MKNTFYLFFAALFIAATMFTACNGSASKAEAPEFVDSYFSMDYDHEGEVVMSVSGKFALVASPGFEALKSALNGLKDGLTKDLLTDGVESYQEIEELYDEGIFSLPWSKYSSIEVVSIGKKMVSLSNNNNEYLGGAHPLYGSESFNIDIQTGENVNLADVVTDYDKVKEVVKSNISAYDEEEDGALYPNWSEILETLFSGENENMMLCWNMTETAIEFYFGPYAIAPYAHGPIVVELNYAEYPGLVKEEYIPVAQTAEVTAAPKVSPLFDDGLRAFTDKISTATFAECKEWAEGRSWSVEVEDPELVEESDGSITLREEGNEYRLVFLFWPDENGTSTLSGLEYRSREHCMKVSKQVGIEAEGLLIELRDLKNYTSIAFSSIDDMVKYFVYNI